MNTTNNKPETHTDTPQSATPTSIILGTNASDCDGAYIGQALRIIEGAGRGEQQLIKSYDGKTKIATLHGTWITTPDVTSVYAMVIPVFTGLREFETSIDVATDQNLKAEFEEKNKDRIDKAVRLMKDHQASNYEVMRECGLAQHVVRRIRKQRVEMTDHPF